MKNFRYLAYLIALSYALASCKDRDNSPPTPDLALSAEVPAEADIAPPPTVTPPIYPKSIALSEITAECLNLPNYDAAIRQLDPSIHALIAATDFKISSESQLRDNFILTMAYAAYQFKFRPIIEITELADIEQNACSSLKVGSADSNRLVYSIVDSSKDFVSALAEDGSSFEVRWLSPTSLKIIKRFTASDIGCSDAKATIEHTSIIDWEHNSQTEINPEEAIYINPDFLAQVADSTGRNIEELYVSDSSNTPSNILSAQALINLGESPIRSGTLVCNQPVDENGSDTSNNMVHP